MKLRHFDEIPDLSTRPDLARILNVHTTTLLRAEKRGRLERIELSRRCIAYTRQQVLDYLLGAPPLPPRPEPISSDLPTPAATGSNPYLHSL